MTQEYKELLLQDLCGRIPYGVKMNHVADMGNNPVALIGIAKTMITLESAAGYGTSNIEDYIPYLFPLSSMTPKQKAELSMLVVGVEDIFKSFLIEVEFYHKHHIDYRGLIEKGLAVDATGLNIY